jgi:hypothetical protein
MNDTTDYLTRARDIAAARFHAPIPHKKMAVELVTLLDDRQRAISSLLRIIRDLGAENRALRALVNLKRGTICSSTSSETGHSSSSLRSRTAGCW